MYDNCKTCNDSYKEGDMNCISCKDDFYKLNETNNCYNKTLLNESFYFKDDMFYPCDDNCLTCSEGKNEISNNCLSCDNINKVYLLEDINNFKSSNYSGYYLDNNILRKCFRSCKTCGGSLEINTEMNMENHNCLECAENYYNLPDGSYSNNCYDNQTINSWKINEETSWMDYITETSYKIKDTTSNVKETTFNMQYLTSNIPDSTSQSPYKILLKKYKIKYKSIVIKILIELIFNIK